MKILHTADWHIGKKLHKHELSRDFDLFIDWLCQLLEKEKIDLLLVSGDVFDLANPSSEARTQYYRALMKLKQHRCRIILTGGNHDSPAMLDAPREVLRELDIHIIGGMPQNPEEVIIPVHGSDGTPEVIVAAIPFLRDSDLRSANDGLTYEDRLEATRKGIEKTFFEAADFCQKNHPEIPVLAMGHLFAAGMEGSESERDIQIGNQAAFEASQFGEYFSYVALGHIHKPQRVAAPIPAFYSGSPLPLSFSERKDEKRLLLLDTTNGWEPESIKIPAFRSLLKISGELSEIKQKLDALQEQKQLESLIEVELLEEQYDAMKIFELDELVTNFEKPGFLIVKHRATFSNRTRGAADLYEAEKQLQDLKPKDVFMELIASHDYSEDIKQEIVSAFDELLEEVQQNENNFTA